MLKDLADRRVQLWLIFAACVTPVLVSYGVFYFAAPTKHTNYGELLNVEPLPAMALRLVDGTPFDFKALKGKWILLMVDSGSCDVYCQKKLFYLRQLKLGQGKNSGRIERVWLISDERAPDETHARDYAGTWQAASGELLRRLPAPSSITDHIYLIDPLGNLALRYPRDADPLKIIRDLTRVMTVSRIG